MDTTTERRTLVSVPRFTATYILSFQRYIYEDDRQFWGHHIIGKNRHNKVLLHGSYGSSDKDFTFSGSWDGLEFVPTGEVWEGWKALPMFAKRALVSGDLMPIEWNALFSNDLREFADLMDKVTPRLRAVTTNVPMHEHEVFMHKRWSDYF